MQKIIEFDSLDHLYASEYEPVRGCIEIGYHRGFGIIYSMLKNESYAVRVCPDNRDQQARKAHKLIYKKTFGTSVIARLTYRNHPDRAIIPTCDMQAMSKKETQIAIEKAKKAIDIALKSIQTD